MKLLSGLQLAAIAYAKDDLFPFHQYATTGDYLINYLTTFNEDNTVRFNICEAKAIDFDENHNIMTAEKHKDIPSSEALSDFKNGDLSACTDDEKTNKVEGQDIYPRRRVNGKCVNTLYPTVGMRGAVFRVMRRMNKEQQTEVKFDINTPPAEDVANLLRKQDSAADRAHHPGINVLTAIWLQFMLHDWLQVSRNMKEYEENLDLKDTDAWPGIPGNAPQPLWATNNPDGTKIPEGEPEFEKWITSNVTHWWDSSMIYGSTTEQHDRIKDGAKLKVGDNRLLRDDINSIGGDPIVTGFNDNMWTGLEWLHTLWHKEHNWIVDNVLKQDDEAKNWSDDRQFHTARQIINNIINKVHSVEWTPILFDNERSSVGQRSLWGGHECYQNYRNLFQTDARVICKVQDWIRRKDESDPWGWTTHFISVYRLHFLLNDKIEVEQKTGGASDEITLEDMIHDGTSKPESSNPKIDFNDDGTDALLTAEGKPYLLDKYGFINFGNALLSNNMGAPAMHNYPHHLTAEGGFIFDMPLVEIYRDRQFDNVRYGDWLEAIGMPRPTSWDEIYPDNGDGIQKEIKDVYGDDIDAVDTLIGLTAQQMFANIPGHSVVDPSYMVFALQTPMRTFRDKYYAELRQEKYVSKLGMKYLHDTFFDDVLSHHDISQHLEVGGIASLKRNNAFRVSGDGERRTASDAFWEKWIHIDYPASKDKSKMESAQFGQKVNQPLN